MGPELSLTIPIYNEEVCIKQSVTNIVKGFEKEGLDYELILVNHGSIDGTEGILNILAKENERLRVFNLPENLGFGGGIMYGFSKSNGEYIGFDCADGEIPVEGVLRVYREAKKSNDEIVKALRIRRKTGLFRRFTSLVFNSLILIRFNLKVKDMNGYPLFMKKEDYEKLNVKRTDFMFNLDLYKQAVKKGFKIKEVPIEHGSRIGGESSMNFKGIVKMAWSLVEYSFS